MTCLPPYTEEAAWARIGARPSQMEGQGLYLFSLPPSLIVGPGLLDAAPQVGALSVKLPRRLLQDPPIGGSGLLAKGQGMWANE